MTVLIAGGGTGGHVFPMLAVGEAIRGLRPEAEIFYVGTERGMETRAIPAAGGDLELLDIAPLRGGGVRGFLHGSFRALRSLEASRRLIERRRPDVVLSVGGYAGGPIALVARLMGIPLAVLEPNSVIGLTNRLLAPFAARAYTAFREVEGRFSRSALRSFGVPLRRDFAPSAYSARPDRLRILVIGGSLGAKAMNEKLPAPLSRLLVEHPEADIVHQCGRGRGDDTTQAYRSENSPMARVRVVEFIDDIGSELEVADLVILRCGAGALSELCAVGRAGVLIPFPFAVDQHQMKNARSLEAQGAAVVLPQDEANSEHIFQLVSKLAVDPQRRQAMADRARELGRPGAARAIAEDLLGLAGQEKSRV